jgi:hypothetical protein
MELEGVVQNGVIVPLDECSLPEGSKVRIEPVEQNGLPADVAEPSNTDAGPSARPMPLGVGQYHSGQRDGSERARELIRQAVKGQRWP